MDSNNRKQMAKVYYNFWHFCKFEAVAYDLIPDAALSHTYFRSDEQRAEKDRVTP